MPNWKKLIVSGSDATLNSLNVTSNGTFGGAAIFPNVPSDNNIRLINTAATGHSKLEIQDNSNNLLVFISSSGNVGIGTSTSSQKLRVQGDFRVDSGFLLVSNGAGPTTEYLHYKPTDKALSLNATSSNTNFDPQFLIRQDGAVKAQFGWDDDGGNELFIKNASGGPIHFLGSSSELGRFTSAGNFGIGLTNPSQKLEVAGAIHATGSTLIASNDAADSVGLSLRSPISGVNVNFDFEVGDTGISGLHAKNLVIRGSSGASDLAFSPSTSAPGLMVLDGSEGAVLISGSTTVRGSIDADDVTIDDWGSVSASLATISDAGGVNGSGAANKLAIWSDADTLTSDTNLHWDTSNDRLGIGTTTPLELLHVGNSSGNNNFIFVDKKDNSAAGIKIAESGSTRIGFMRVNLSEDLEIGTENNDDLFLLTSGSTRVTVKGNDGDVGIGTNNPESRLHITDANPVIILEDTSNPNKNKIENVDGNMRYHADYGSDMGNSRHIFFIDNSEKVRFDTNGNVGINVTSPSKKLSVDGQTSFFQYTNAHLTNNAFSNFNFETLVNHASATSGGSLNAYVKIGAGATNNSLADFNAIRTRAYAENTTVNVLGLINFYAEYRNFTSTNSVNLTHHYGLKVDTLGVGGNATVTNNYGVYLNPGTAATNNYGVFQAGGSVKNKFEGPVGINTLPASGVELHVNGEIRVDSTDGVATRKIRSGYFSSTSDIAVASGISGSVLLQNGNNTVLTLSGSNQEAEFAGDVIIPQFLKHSGDADTYFGFSANNQVLFHVGGGDRVIINSSGLVGIGTTTPVRKLHVEGNSGGNELFLAQDTNSTLGTKIGRFKQEDGTNNPFLDISSTSSGMLLSTGFSTGIPGSFVLQSSGGSSYLALNTNGANERMRIDSSGKVGIGTTAPSTLFHVEGDPNSAGVLARFKGSNSHGSLIQFDRGSSFDWKIGVGGGSASTGIPSSYFGIAGVGITGPSFVIAHTTGNVGIGTTNPNTDFHVNGEQLIKKVDTSTAHHGTLNIKANVVAANSNHARSAFINLQGAAVSSNSITNYDFVLGTHHTGDFIIARDNSFAGGYDSGSLQISRSDLTVTVEKNLIVNEKLGIGTASPSQKLSVEGNIELGTGGYIYGDTTTPFLRLNNAAGTVLGYSNGNISIGPSFVYNNASGEQFRINHSNGNVGIGSSSPGKTLDIVGEARVNKLDHYEFLTSTNDSLSFNYATRNLAMPVNAYLWHDLLGFDYNYTRTQEISTNGTTFSSHTLQTALFAQKQDQSVTVLESNEVAVRWTFQGVAWSLPDWMNLAFTHVSSDISKDILIESSADGSTWTTRHTSTVAAGISTKTLFISSFNGDTYLRLTITKTNNSSTNLVKMSSIKLMTARAGDQGQGMEYQFPYTWDYDRRIAIGHSPTTGVYEASLAIKGKTADSTAHALVIRNSSNTSLLSVRNDGRVDIPASSLITGGDVSVGDELSVTTINGTTTDHDKFLVSDSGTVKFVSGSQLLSQIGGASAGDFVTLTTNQTIEGVKTFTEDIHLDDNDGASPGLRLIDGDNIAFRILNGGSNQLNITRTGNGGNDIALEADATSHADSVLKIGGTSTFGHNTIISGSLQVKDDILVNTATSGRYIQIDHSDDSLKLADNNRIKLGTGNDLQIVHDGSNSFIQDVGTGNLFIEAVTSIMFRKYNTAEFMAKFINDGAVELYYDNSKKLETTSGGVNITGDMVVSGNITAQEFHTEFVSASIIYESGSTKFGDTQDDIHDFTGSLKVTGSTTLTGTLSSGDITISDANPNLRIDDTNGRAVDIDVQGNTFRIDDVGNNAAIFSSDLSTNPVQTTFHGPLTVNGSNTNLVGSFVSTDSIAEIRIQDNTAYSRILNVGTQLKLMPNDGVEMMILDGNANTVKLPDDVKLVLGTGQDLRIFHETGNTSKIENYTGSLVIQQRADGKDIAFQCDDGSGGLTEYLRFDGGDVKTIVSKTMEFQDSIKLAIGNSEDLVIDHNGTNSRITNYTGNLRIINGSDGDDITFEGDDGTGQVTEYFRLDGGAAITIVSREMRFTDNVKAKFGTGPDLEIYHSGTHSFIDGSSGTGSLYIRPGTGGTIQLETQSGTDMITAAASSAKLFQNGNEKLATTAGGVDITGTLNTTGNLTITNTVPSINLTDSDNDSDYTVRNNNGVFEVFDATNNDARLTISSTGYATFASTIKSENGILALGSDVTLFRDGTNILRTDDVFHANNGIHVGGTGKIFDRSGDDSFIHFDHANSKIRIQEGGEEMITIDSGTVRINAAQGNNDFVIEGNSDTNLLRADGSADRVGIGKATPADKLDVFGNIRISNPNGLNPADAGSLVFGETGGSWGSGLYGFRFFSDGSNNVLRLQSSANTDTLDNILVAERDVGNIGIGVANPDTRLHVSSSTGFSIKTERAIQDGARNGHTHFYTAGNAHIFGRPLILESSFRLTPSTPSNTTKSYRIMNNSEILKVALEVGGSTVTDNILTVSGSNVGIGTATPINKFQVNGDSRVQGSLMVGSAAASNIPATALHVKSSGTNAVIRIEDSDNSNKAYDFLVDEGNGLYIKEDSDTRLFIKEGGNVGIGTTTPTAKLHLQSSENAATSNLLYLENIGSGGNEGVSIKFNPMFNAESMIASNREGAFSNVSNLTFHTYSGSMAEAMRITSTGNVGIGTNSPGRTLHAFHATVNEVARFESGDSGAFIQFKDNNTDKQPSLGNIGNNLTFRVSGSEAARFDIDGNFGIGVNGTVRTRLHLSGSSAADSGIRQSRDGVKIWTQEIDNNGKLQWAYRATEGGTATEHFTLNDTGQAILHGYGSGNFTGTAAKTLAVDSSGNIIETDGGGSGTIDGSGTGGFIPKWSDSDTLTDSLLEESSNVINLGTTSTTGNFLHVRGSATNDTYDVFKGTRKYPRITLVDSFGGANNTYQIWNLGNQLRFGSSPGSENTAAFYIKGGGAANVIFNGKIGVGTSSPNAKVHIGPDSLVSGYTPDRTTLAISDITDGGQLIIRGQSPRIWFDTTSGGNAELFLDGSKLNILSGDPTSSGSSRLYIKADGNVGINTTAPNEKLHVEGTSRFNGDMHFGSDTNGLVFRPVEGGSAIDRYFLMFDETNNASFPFLTNRAANGAVVIKTGTAAGSAENEHFRIKGGDGTVDAYFTNANVGIGTTSPSSILHLASTTGPRLILEDTDTSIGVDSVIADISFVGGEIGGETARIAAVSETAGGEAGLRFYTGQSVDEQLRITKDGNVGIGTTSPSTLLHIDSTGDAVTFSRTGQETYKITHGTSGLYFTRPNSSALAFGVTQNSDLDIFDTNGDIMFRADASVGKVSIGNSSPTEALDVTGNIRQRAGLRGGYIGTINYAEYYFTTGDAGGSFLIGQIENSGNADGAITATVHFAYDYGTTTNNCTLHFNFAQRSGTARGTWWYEGDDQDSASDRVHARLIDDGSGNMYVWITCVDFANVFVETKQRHITNFVSAGQLTAGTLTTGTTLFDTANAPTAEIHVGEVYIQNNKGLVSTNVAGADRTLIELDSNNDLKIKGNDSEGSGNVIKMQTGGVVTFGSYGSGTHTGTSTKSLHVTSAGKIIEKNPAPKVEYQTISSDIATNTTFTLPNSLSYVLSSGGFEYLEIFLDGIRLNRGIDFEEISTTSIKVLMAIPAGSVITYKSII